MAAYSTLGNLVPQYLRTKLKYWAYKFSRDKRKKCLVYGNCQTRVISKMLCLNEHFNNEYCIVPISPVHSIQREEVPILIEQVVSSDLFIYQPVKQNYRGIPELSSEYLKTLIAPSAKTIAIPSLYFSAYSPEIFYVYGDSKRVCPGPFGDYHNLLIYNSFINRKSIDETLNILNDSSLISYDIAHTLYHMNIEEIMRRESEFGLLKISDFIKDNYQKYRLFHTMNHPSDVLLKYVISKLLTEINLDLKVSSCSDSNFNQENDVFASPSFNILPSVFQGLNLGFDYSRKSNINGNLLSQRNVVELFYHFYESNAYVFESKEYTYERMSKVNEVMLSQVLHQSGLSL